LQIFKLLLGHQIIPADFAKGRMFLVATLQQVIPYLHHEILKVDPAGAEKGALLTGQTIPQGLFILNVIRDQCQLLHYPPWGALVYVLPIKIEHGADCRAFPAL
jgi:hypothetical protein